MTVVGTRDVPRLTTAIRRAIESVLPWYDPEDTTRRDERSERVRQRAIATRVRAEQTRDVTRKLRADYAAYAARLRR